MAVQGFVGLFTWLVVQYDDIVGQNDEMVEDALKFHERLFNGERQPNNLLEGIAELLRESPEHFDPVMSNQLQISLQNGTDAMSALHGFVAGVLERCSEGLASDVGLVVDEVAVVATKLFLI